MTICARWFPLLAAALTLLCAGARAEETVVWDFQDLESVGTYYVDHGKTYSRDGYTLSAWWYDITHLWSAQTECDELWLHYQGSTGLLVSHYGDHYGLIERDDGEPFDLVFMQVASQTWDTYFEHGGLDLIGLKSDSTTVTQAVRVPLVGFHGVVIEGFEDLLSLRIYSSPIIDENDVFHRGQFDHLVFRHEGSTSVAERPTTWGRIKSLFAD